MSWLAIPAVLLAAYLGAKFEDTAIVTAIGVVLWTIIAAILLGSLALAFGLALALLATL